MASSVPDTNGVYFIPALSGLMAPHQDPFARGMMIGITRGTTDAHIARATLEAIAFSIKDILNIVEENGVKIKEIKIDGGASKNNLLAQTLADYCDAEIMRPESLEATALGAAYIVFYGKGRGGITASGGEPLLHAEFIRTLFEYCHAHNITTAIETCLCVGKEQVREVLEVTDYVMCDYKHWNKEKFYQWTGGNLDIIEENLADILSSKKDVVVRIPLIPDFNADKETIQRMCKKLRDFGAEKIELLPYHRLGKIKYENMNMSYQMKDDRLLPEELIRELKSIPESM